MTQASSGLPGTTGHSARASRARETVAATLRAAHGGPALAVTALSGALALGSGLDPGRTLLIVVTVLTSQLSIGWSNDLLDLERDRAVQRTDKPLVGGLVRPGLVRGLCGAALVATVLLSLLCGAAAAVVHLVNTASGWAYNLGLKATAWSWLPYAVAFGGLPVFVALAGQPAALPPLWQVAAGALLGVGAHFLNVLPDLEDDERTGVRGLPHRLGDRASRGCAVVLLAAATTVIVLGAGATSAGGLVAIVLVAALLPVALRGSGRAPFLAAVAIALVDVVLWVAST
jgi:4-hydroxybenzoate polyprenyltransferase